MPELDFPLEELKKYRGTNPCPKDMDAFWNSSLEELTNHKFDIEMKRADFQTDFAECFDLTFTGLGGARVYAKYLRPAGGTGPYPAVMEFHGYTINSGDWTDKLKYVAAGFCVASMDCRGQGGRSRDIIDVAGPTLQGHIIRGLEDGRDHLMYRYLFLDTVQLTRIVKDFSEVDDSRLAATGQSQGGGLTLACAALEPSITYAAPVFPFLSDYKRVWEMDLALDAYKELKIYFRQYDPHHFREDEIFTTLGYIDVKNLAERIKAKVFMGITLMDNICPPSTQFAAYNRITSDKRCSIYHDYGHENLPGMQDDIFQFLMEMKK